VKDATKRSIHIVFAIPIVGYIYSPFKELPNYAPVVRYVALPAIVLSGLWMWKGHVLRRPGVAVAFVVAALVPSAEP
jgi:hypothetical protein